MAGIKGKRRYSLERNAFRVAFGGAWVVKNRVVGMFSIRIKRVWRLSQRLKSIDKLIDVTERKGAKTLVLLDDGTGILSPFSVHTMASHFDPEAKEE